MSASTATRIAALLMLTAPHSCSPLLTHAHRSSSAVPASARAAAACWSSMPLYPMRPCSSACWSIHRLWASHADCLLVPRAAPICDHEAPAPQAGRRRRQQVPGSKLVVTRDRGGECVLGLETVWHCHAFTVASGWPDVKLS